MKKSKSLKIGVALLALLMTLRLTGDFLPIDLTLVYVTVAGYLVIVRLFLKSNIGTILKVPKLLVLFYLLFILSAFFSNFGEYALNKIVLFGSFAVLPFFFGPLYLRHVSSFIKIFVFLYIINVSFIVIYPFVYGGEGLFTSISRKGFTLTDSGNSNVVSAYVVTGILSLYYSIKKKSVRRNSLLLMCYYLVLSISLVLLFLTGSKGAYLSLTGAFCFILLSIDKFRSATIRIAAVIILVVIFVIYGNSFLLDITPESWHGFIENQLLEEANFESVDSRIFLMEAGIKDYLEGSSLPEFLFGHGLADFAVLLGDFQGRTYPHNIFIEILYEMGIVAMLVFIFLIFLGIKSGISDSKYASDELIWLYAMFVAFFIRSITTDDLGGNIFIFVFLHVIYLIRSNFSLKSNAVL